MTFTEAAVEVLRIAGTPLHYKKITEIAIEKNLLSHVGKTPETTMSSRLATMVKKDRGDAPILKVKPGVFALREFSEEAIAASAEAAAASTEDNGAEEATKGAAPEAEASAKDSDAEAEDASAANLPGSDVFPEEDDDDELILANLDDSDGREGRNRRKPRPRRRRERSDRDRKPETRQSGRKAAPPARTQVEGDWSRVAADDEMVGRDLADAIEAALRTGNRQPKPLRRVAESLIQNGRLSGDPADLGPTLAAAVRGDNARKSASNQRTRFREVGGMLSLLEWDLPNDTVRAESDAIRAADRQRDSVHRALIASLRAMPGAALMELLATWLNAVGVHSIRGVRTTTGDFSLAGTLRRGPEETPIGITVFKGSQAVGPDAIIDLRGALHRFGQARAAWVITLGQATPEALTEARADGAAPCAIFDAKALAESMEEVGVGVRRALLPLAVLDVDLLESLSGGRLKTEDAKDGGESNGNRKRRGRRRGRRRGSRDDSGETTAEASSDEAGDTSEAKVDSKEASSSEAETPEIKEEKPAETAPEPEAT